MLRALKPSALLLALAAYAALLSCSEQPTAPGGDETRSDRQALVVVPKAGALSATSPKAGALRIWVARQQGADWIALGRGEVGSGYIGRTRVEAFQSNLYVMQINSAQSPQLTVSRFDGTDWADLPNPVGAGEVPTFATGDVAVLSSGPVVAYVTGGVMKVKQLR